MLFAFVFYHEETAGGIGYAHHSVYTVLIVYLLYTGRGLLFAVCAIEEIPTLFLSLFEIFGDQRPRIRRRTEPRRGIGSRFALQQLQQF